MYRAYYNIIPKNVEITARPTPSQALLRCLVSIYMAGFPLFQVNECSFSKLKIVRKANPVICDILLSSKTGAVLRPLAVPTREPLAVPTREPIGVDKTCWAAWILLQLSKNMALTGTLPSFNCAVRRCNVMFLRKRMKGRKALCVQKIIVRCIFQDSACVCGLGPTEKVGTGLVCRPKQRGDSTTRGMTCDMWLFQ